MAGADLRIALLIDGDNIQAPLIASAIKELDKYGKCPIRRVYGDWKSQSLSSSKWPEVAKTYGIELVQQDRSKNSTDMAIVIDATEIWASKSNEQKVDTFCIVSSDSDFLPLTKYLMKKGAIVIVAGKANTPTTLKKACFKFIPLDKLGNPQSVQKITPKNNPNVVKAIPNPSPLKNPVKDKVNVVKVLAKSHLFDEAVLVKKAYHMSAQKGGWLSLYILGDNLRTLAPQFFETQVFSSTVDTIQRLRMISLRVSVYYYLFEVKPEEDNERNLVNIYLKLKT